MKFFYENLCESYQRALLEAVKANSQIPRGPPTQPRGIINRAQNICDVTHGCSVVEKNCPLWEANMDKVAALERATWPEMDKKKMSFSFIYHLFQKIHFAQFALGTKQVAI